MAGAFNKILFWFIMRILILICGVQLLRMWPIFLWPKSALVLPWCPAQHSLGENLARVGNCGTRRPLPPCPSSKCGPLPACGKDLTQSGSLVVKTLPERECMFARDIYGILHHNFYYVHSHPIVFRNASVATYIVLTVESWDHYLRLALFTQCIALCRLRIDAWRNATLGLSQILFLHVPLRSVLASDKNLLKSLI